MAAHSTDHQPRTSHAIRRSDRPASGARSATRGPWLRWRGRGSRRAARTGRSWCRRHASSEPDAHPGAGGPGRGTSAGRQTMPVSRPRRRRRASVIMGGASPVKPRPQGSAGGRRSRRATRGAGSRRASRPVTDAPLPRCHPTVLHRARSDTDAGLQRPRRCANASDAYTTVPSTRGNTDFN